MIDAVQLKLIRSLADGHWHSGARLAEELGVSRTAVWKRLRRFEQLGLRLEARRSLGYRMEPPLQLLERGALSSALSGEAQDLPLHLLESTASTNAWLDQRSESAAICLAEHQLAGRGRRGRSWYSPFGRNIYLSVLWTWPAWPPRLPALGLQVAIHAVQALQECKLPVGLKWPNDLYMHGRKLGGILIEQRGEQGGPCRVVVGIGVNLAHEDNAPVDQPWSALEQADAELPERNLLAARLVNTVVRALAEFADLRSDDLVNGFERHDVFREQAVRITDGDRTLTGRAGGIDEFGRLRLQTDTGEVRVAVGDVSLRREADGTVR